MSGLYAADGSINVTVVDGSSYTGLYAADGSWNVFKADGTHFGYYHPCGAMIVTVASTGTVVGSHAADGSVNVCTSPYDPSGALRVTVVSGSLGGGGPFLLMADGVSKVLLADGTDRLLITGLGPSNLPWGLLTTLNIH